MTDESKNDEITETAVDDDIVSKRRRALIQAGWTVPIVTAATGLPSNSAFAQSPHSDGHADAPPHSDAIHNDLVHSDVVHNDAVHNDVVHSDAVHNDVHGDAPSSGHGDAHDDVTVLHIDIPHVDSPFFFDIPHGDTSFAHGDSHNDTPAFP